MRIVRRCRSSSQIICFVAVLSLGVDVFAGLRGVPLIPTDSRVPLQADLAGYGRSVAVSDDGRVAVGGNGYVAVFDARTGELLDTVGSITLEYEQADRLGLAIEDDWLTFSAPVGHSDVGLLLHDLATPSQRQLGTATRPSARLLSWYNSPRHVIDGGTSLIGLSGSALRDPGTVLVHDVHTGTLLRELRPNDPDISDGFGSAVDLHNGIAIVGAEASASDSAPGFPGAAYLFNVATGEQLLRLQPDDLPFLSVFGAGVAIRDSTAVVAQPDLSATDSLLHVFDVETGERRYTTRAIGNVSSVGHSVSIANDKIIASGLAYLEPRGGYPVAIVFDLETGLQLAEIGPPSPAAYRYETVAPVDAAGDYVALGNPFFSWEPEGNAFVYDVSDLKLPGDFNGDRRIDNADLSLLIAHWGESTDTLSGDWVGRPAEGATVDNSELSELLYAWGAGVPDEAVAVIPEPSALMLLATLTLTSAGSRRRLA